MKGGQESKVDFAVVEGSMAVGAVEVVDRVDSVDLEQLLPRRMHPEAVEGIVDRIAVDILVRRLVLVEPGRAAESLGTVVQGGDTAKDRVGRDMAWRHVPNVGH